MLSHFFQRNFKFKLLAFFLLISSDIFAVKEVAYIIPVGEAALEKTKLYIENPFGVESLLTKNKELANKVVSIVRNDFYFYKKFFNVIDPGKEKSKKSFSEVDFSFWGNKKVGVLVQIKFFEDSSGLKYSYKVYSIDHRREVVSLEGEVMEDNPRRIAHKISDTVYRGLTGKPSIFHSVIVFVSDIYSSKNKSIKELFIMDFDGGNVKRLTFHRGTVISPSISHDGKRILYSLIHGDISRDRNINLYVYDVDTKKSSLVSSRKGLNSGAIFMPDNDEIALTLSTGGNADIYVMNLKTKKTRRITKHYGIDVDPSISFDGSLMSILTSRSGKAMIYTLDPSGVEKSVKRISFIGDFNATPRFSPDGKEIAFSSWLDNRFDIFRINADGTGLSRLTKNFGSNEDPTYSNDGRFIAFSSQRVLSKKKAVQDIYIMDRDGEIIGAVTKNFGNCISPRLSKYL
jgi:TolB protein